MKNKLIITRITAYGLSSLLTIPVLLNEFHYEILQFILVMYFIIFFITKYYNKIKNLDIEIILLESITTTLFSFVGALISSFYYMSKIDFISTLIFGSVASIIIGLVLFILNALSLKST